MEAKETKSSQINREIQALERAFMLEEDTRIKERLGKIIDRKVADFIFSFVAEMNTKLGRLISIDEDDIEEMRRRPS